MLIRIVYFAIKYCVILLKEVRLRSTFIQRCLEARKLVKKVKSIYATFEVF